MIDLGAYIQEHLLELGLPVYNELKVQKTTGIPCITWRLDNDMNNVVGDNLSFNWIQFSVKIWCNDLAVIAQHTEPLSLLMKELGFQQIGSNQLTAGGVTQLETRWRGIYRQNYE